MREVGEEQPEAGSVEPGGSHVGGELSGGRALAGGTDGIMKEVKMRSRSSPHSASQSDGLFPSSKATGGALLSRIGAVRWGEGGSWWNCKGTRSGGSWGEGGAIDDGGWEGLFGVRWIGFLGGCTRVADTAPSVVAKRSKEGAKEAEEDR
jgi:hypothetical protein